MRLTKHHPPAWTGRASRAITAALSLSLAWPALAQMTPLGQLAPLGLLAQSAQLAQLAQAPASASPAAPDSPTSTLTSKSTPSPALDSTSDSASAPQPYVDKLIDGLAAEDANSLPIDDYNSAGWSRNWHVDYSLLAEHVLSRSSSQTISLGGFLDSPNYGTLSLSANLSQQRSSSLDQASPYSSRSWRLDQRGVPLGGGWRANYSAGDINTGALALARGNGRITLPTSPIRGLSGQWYQGSDLDLQAATGQTGLFNGLGLGMNGFATSAGQLSTVGAQFRLPSGGASGLSQAAVQLIDGQHLRDGGVLMNTRGIWLAQSWEGIAPWASSLRPGSSAPAERPGGLRLQTNLLQSSRNSVLNSVLNGDSTLNTGTLSTGNEEPNRRALGLWLDANWRAERWQHSAGGFRLEPNLRWGSQAMANDIQGLYWQADSVTRQWQYGLSSEVSDRISQSPGSDGRSAYLSLSTRWRIDSQSSLGGNLNLRAFNGSGQGLSLYSDQRKAWGQTQWRADLTHTPTARSSRLGWAQNWAVTAPARLDTSLAWESRLGDQDAGRLLIWGLQASLPSSSAWSIDAALRGEQRSHGNRGETLNADFGVRWQAGSGWSLSLRYAESRGRQLSQPQVLSALAQASLPTLTQMPAMRSLQLLLRYEERAGKTYAPLGGAPGSAAGSLSGVVFFDADANQRRDAFEGGVPNISVILDRRYVTRTDSQGRYAFQAVAEGPHLVEISTDNLPLPWSPLLRSAVQVNIAVRETRVQDFAVQREP